MPDTSPPRPAPPRPELVVPLEQLRRDAGQRWARSGWPSHKIEAWKYTSLERLGALGLPPAEAVRLGNIPEPIALEGWRFVLVNGRLDRALSVLDGLPAGVTVASLAERLDAAAPHLGRLVPEDAPLAQLNTASFVDGCYVEVAPGVTLDQPIHIISIGASGQFHPRHLVRLGDGALATVFEDSAGTGAGRGGYLANTVLEAQLGARAVLRHVKLQDDAAQAFHIASSCVALAQHAQYDRFVLSLGASLARDEVRVRFDDHGGEARLGGAYLGREAQHLDHTLFVDHAAPGCLSRQLYKGVLDGRARGVFQGKILVRPGAGKTDGHQLNRALLLSRGAEIDSKPELEIYADDVLCSHGATAGELEEAELFYLRSRGIDLDTARAMLVEGFLGEAVEMVALLPLRAALKLRIASWLAARAAQARAA